MKLIEVGSLWYLLKNYDDYYIQQLSGSMHTETAATYKLLDEEVNNYLKLGNEALSKTIIHFNNVGNYSCLSAERRASLETISKIQTIIKMFLDK
ncbi:MULTISPECIES: hypothetical protein [Pseudoalteromonas]|jgi:hypothetical protein|uniref:hypothetical protein n=1 Tax=Pseudoalteromonas TaxID=53246 RepID=UPI0004047A09|nr:MULTISPECIES: hypothetical protein [Pseudoalteromonas]TVU76680.1 hypothetical protein FQP81_06570 [Pseudoalteromonas elyakovii]|tara:strand:- start:1227 stop:1511 length:285 start_codon:yes stop_codon:yes gene_type:complete